MELNYSNYLRLPELLDLQTLQSLPEEHDELLFITIHQVTELWLKQLLHELDKTRRDLRLATQRGAIITGKRSVKALIISKERLPEPMTIEARNSMTGTLDSRNIRPTSWRLRRCAESSSSSSPSPPK